METAIFQDIVPQEREQTIRDNARFAEQSKHYRSLTPDEIEARKLDLVNDVTTLGEIEAEKKAVMKDFSDRIKEIKTTVGKRLDSINTRSEQVEEELFAYDDQRAGMMTFYNANGDMVYSRPLSQQERQLHIVTEIGNLNRDRTGTDN